MGSSRPASWRTTAHSYWSAATPDVTVIIRTDAAQTQVAHIDLELPAELIGFDDFAIFILSRIDAL